MCFCCTILARGVWVAYLRCRPLGAYAFNACAAYSVSCHLLLFFLPPAPRCLCSGIR